MWVLLWFPRMTIGRLYRPVNAWLDTMAADVEFLVKQYKQANPK